MCVWSISPIEDEPETTLYGWHIFETPAGTRHFCGYARAQREGRVSSAVIAFDPATMSGRTASGRVYRLEGPRGSHPDADYVKSAWLARAGCESATVVEDLETIETASPSP